MVQETIAIVIEGKDNASDDLNRVGKNIDDLNKKAKTTGSTMKTAGAGVAMFATGAGLAVGAGVALGSAAVNLGGQYRELGQQVRATTAIFETMSGGVEESEALLNRLQFTTKGVVADIDLMSGANQLMRMGIANNADEVERFIDIAVKLKQPTQSASEAIDNLAMMIANQSYERLDSFGISSAKVRQEMQLLREAGMGVEEAFSTAFLSVSEEPLLQLNDAIDQSITKFEQLQVILQNQQGKIAQPINSLVEALSGAFIVLTQNPTGEELETLLSYNREQIALFMEQMGWIEEATRNREQFPLSPAGQALQQQALGITGGVPIYVLPPVGDPSATSGMNLNAYIEYPQPPVVPTTPLTGVPFTLDQHLATVNQRLQKEVLEYERYIKGIANAPNTYLNQMARGEWMPSTLISIQSFIDHFEGLQEVIEDDVDVLQSFGQSAEYAVRSLNMNRIETQDWYEILDIFTRANEKLEQISEIKLMNLDSLLGREAPASNQQTGLVQMMLGYVDDDEIRSSIEREMDLLTGRESTIGDFVETEISSYIAGIAETLGSDVAFSMIEAVQNVLQTGEFLNLDDEEVMQRMQQALLQSTPRAELMAGSGSYVVQPGDTPWGILASMGVPTPQLPMMSQQMLQMYGMLQPGMNVSVPGFGGGGMLPSDAILTSSQLGLDATAPIEKLVSDEAQEEIDALQTDFDQINEKIRLIQNRVNQTFSDVSMTATVYIRAKFDEADKKYIDYAMSNSNASNLFRPRQEMPGGSPPPEQTID